eukprot:g3923.t1
MSGRVTRHRGLEAKAAELAALIQASRKVVFITGAGISTNAAIRDYRGPNGIWTEAKKRGLPVGADFWSDEFLAAIPAALPTFTHRAIAALTSLPRSDNHDSKTAENNGNSGNTDQRRGSMIVDYVITQNEDALHIRSGMDRARLSEIHGNAFIEICAPPCRVSPAAGGGEMVVAATTASGSCGSRGSRGSRGSGSGSSEESEETIEEAVEAGPAVQAAAAEAGAGRVPSIDEDEFWVQCSRCKIWHLVPASAGLKASDMAADWTCAEAKLWAPPAHTVCRPYPTEGDDGGGSDSSSSSSSSSANKRKRVPASTDNDDAKGYCCGRSIVRDFVVYHDDSFKRDHAWGYHRLPPPWAGTLLDSSVNFGDIPDGPPWGCDNDVHRMGAAVRAMDAADLVVVWGSTLRILAESYFDPWNPKSDWRTRYADTYLKPPSLLSPPSSASSSLAAEAAEAVAAAAAAPPAAAAAGGGGRPGARSAKARPRATATCKLAIVGFGKVHHEEHAVLRIEEDVDKTMKLVIAALGVELSTIKNELQVEEAERKAKQEEADKATTKAAAEEEAAKAAAKEAEAKAKAEEETKKASEKAAAEKAAAEKKAEEEDKKAEKEAAEKAAEEKKKAQEKAEKEAAAKKAAEEKAKQPATFSNICLSAKGDKPATINLASSAKVSKITFTHKSGQVSCSGTGGAANFGCGDNLIGIVLVKKGSKTVLLPTADMEGITKTSHGHAWWYNAAGTTKNSKTLTWNVDGKKELAAGEYQVWFNEDLTGGTESDNWGSACYDMKLEKVVPTAAELNAEAAEEEADDQAGAEEADRLGEEEDKKKEEEAKKAAEKKAAEEKAQEEKKKADEKAAKEAEEKTKKAAEEKAKAPVSFSNVCLSAKGDDYATIKLASNTKISKITFTHKSGQVSCSGTGGASNFGCGDNLIGIVLVKKGSKTVLLPTTNMEGITKTSHGHAWWYNAAGTTKNSKTLTWKV